MNREQLRANLRKLHRSPARVETIMYLIDRYVETLTGADPEPETWPADRVAAYLGLSSTHSARAVMSQAGISSLKVEQIPGQRAYARYPADKVRTLRKERDKK